VPVAARAAWIDPKDIAAHTIVGDPLNLFVASNHSQWPHLLT